MHNNNSPWIFELKTDRKSETLKRDESADIAIIGAGIAGISTAFFILENTKKSVILAEGYKLAHGATGHNAGQVLAYMERPFKSIVDEFGLEMACDGQKSIETGWTLIEDMYTKAGLTIPFTRFSGSFAFATKEYAFEHLERNYLVQKGGLLPEEKDFWIADNCPWLDEAKKKFPGAFKVVSQKEILERADTHDDEYVALSIDSIGCVNSAAFSEGVGQYLLKKYPDRFKFFEYTPIGKVVLKENFALLDAGMHEIIAKKVVLCTNGFENIEIFDRSGLGIDKKFHKEVSGVIGYMGATVSKSEKFPFNCAYSKNPKEPYFYVTRRQYDFGTSGFSTLTCVGGPEINLEDRKHYIRDYAYPEDAKEKIENFIKETYGEKEEKKFEKAFFWHGLMGYTKNMLRLIGEEPQNEILLYNLGCNGVGILPSIYGGWKIAEILSGKKFSPSIFDPQ